ncbi:MAG: PAS domain S-box protein [Desulfomonilaceae bacterium]
MFSTFFVLDNDCRTYKIYMHLGPRDHAAPASKYGRCRSRLDDNPPLKRNEICDVTASFSDSPAKKWPWILSFLAIAGAFAALAVIYYKVEVRAAWEKAHDQLHAVAALKADQIQKWRKERIAGLRMLVGSPFFSKAARELLKNPDDAALGAAVRQRLQVICDAYRYQDAILLNADMRVILSLKQDPHLLAPEAQETIEGALKNNRIVFGDFYRCSLCGGVHIDVAAALADDRGHPVGVVVFRINPEAELYPLIQSWPAASETAETLLVRKEGDYVLFLNELRHRKGTALALAIPLARTDITAVQALGGQERFVEAKDYRGVDVLADIRPIPGSPWVMIAKVDKDEILSELRYRAGVAAVFALILIISSGAAIGYLFIRRQKSMYQDLYAAEKQASEAKDEFLITLRSIADAVITTDAQGRVRYMNPAAEDLTGWTASEAQGQPLSEVFHILHEKTGQPVQNPVDQALETGSVVALANETVLISKHARQLPIADSAAPIRDETGAVIGVVLVFRDQTERRATQNALRQSKELAERYLDISAQIVLSLDAEGKIVMINNSGCQLLGYQREELLGKDWFETCLSEADRGSVREVFNKLMQGKEQVVSAFECPVLRKDKSPRVILWHNTILKDEQGRPTGVLGSGEDITDRKQAEEGVRRARQDWEDIFQAISHPTIIIDQNHSILDANKAVLTRTGMSVEELRGTKCYELFHKSSEPPADCPAEVLVRSGIATTVEMEMEALGGYFLVSCTPVLDEAGQLRKIIHIATDITDRRRMEEERESLRAQLVQAQKMEAVGTLAGGLAHDFNNILQVTLGYAELLLMDKAFPEAYRTHIKMISESSKRGSDLAKRLLVFSRKTTVELRTMDLNQCVREARKILERTIPKMISIELFLEDGLPNIQGDPTELEQVLVNLAINARDAMPDGGRLTFETHRIFLDEEYARTHYGCTPGQYVLLTVSDTGGGHGQGNPEPHL